MLSIFNIGILNNKSHKKPIKEKEEPIIESKHGSFVLPSKFGYRELKKTKKCITDAKGNVDAEDECAFKYQRNRSNRYKGYYVRINKICKTLLCKDEFTKKECKERCKKSNDIENEKHTKRRKIEKQREREQKLKRRKKREEKKKAVEAEKKQKRAERKAKATAKKTKASDKKRKRQTGKEKIN